MDEYTHTLDNAKIQFILSILKRVKMLMSFLKQSKMILTIQN